MDSENSFASLLEDSFSGDEKVDGSEDYSTKIKDALESLCQRFDAEFLQRALQECLYSCPDKSLDEKIFRETLPTAYHHLSKALKEIGEMTNADEDALDNVKRQLVLCHELLTAWEKSIERASKLNKTSAANLKFLFENTLDMVKSIFEHCRASTRLYGTLFEGVSEKLRNLFRKAKTILNLFLATLENVIDFDTDTDTETELLVNVIDTIGSLVAITDELDLKTFVETSRMFGKLAITHQDIVKRAKSTCVTVHLEQVTKNVTSMLLSLQDALDRADERKIRVIGHSLKILDRLFAAYCPCISNETLPVVIELFLQMHRCNPSCLKKSKISDKVIELINAHISRGSESFLNTILKNSGFKQAFFEYGTQTIFDNFGYHLLTISIIKQLVNVPFEEQCKWALGAESIIDIALTSINNIQEEICTGKVKLPGGHDIGERPRLATLYEATLVPICGLISHIPADGFFAVEWILLKHLFSNQLWGALLSSDIWCFVGRIGSSELCVSHVKYLLKVYAVLMNRHSSLEVVILESLIGRLYSLLSDETKHFLITELDDLENPSWTPVARFLPSKTKSLLEKRLACILNEIPKTFVELQRQPTVQNWNRITMLMCLIGKLNYTGEKDTVDVLSQIWNSVASTIEIFEGKQLDILAEFTWKLFSATQPEKIQDDTFYTVLEAMLTSLLCFPSHVKVIASHYLRNNIGSFDICGVRTANALSELNCRLLEDENPWVRQEALESFDHVAHMCPNEDLVTKMAAAITKKPSLSDSLPAYLSGTPYYELRDFSDAQLYLQHVARISKNVGHVCYHYEESQRDEKFARLEIKLSGSSTDGQSTNDLDEHVNKICDELNDTLKRIGNIGDGALRRLRLVCAKILDTTESSK
ncbi:PREDICTED: uncharacterized protein C1orf112-like [Dufourea novaeangliae]|uniref:uncharacterized protein C1orf112-like n=1 Tax=Dufourea novaeangliae TaxID=178035 RepID=UPI000767C8D8|nr:PREDICTED: uncharacterized protein C1orf112-like [Dufourea novaeangliae]